MAANTTTVAFSPASGNFTGSQVVTLSCAGANGILYTTDGTTPSGTLTTPTGTTQKITGASGTVTVAATEVILAASYVTADSPALGPVTGAAYGILTAAAPNTVTFNSQQFAWVQSIVSRKVQDEATANPAYSGNQSNAGTFQQTDLSVAQQVLAILQGTA